MPRRNRANRHAPSAAAAAPGPEGRPAGASDLGRTACGTPRCPGRLSRCHRRWIRSPRRPGGSTRRVDAMARRLWELHGDGRTVTPGAVVRPEERLPWGRTAGIGMQHVVAMFGATFLVPVLTGFPPATTILFSGIGTLLFLVITRNRVPSYLGSSFAFIAPVIAAKAR